MNLIDTYGKMYVIGLGTLFVTLVLITFILGIWSIVSKYQISRESLLSWWPLWWGGIGLFMGIPWLTFLISQWGVSLLIDSLLSMGIWISLGGVLWRFPWTGQANDPVYDRLGREKIWIHRGGLVLMGIFFLGVGYVVFV